MAPTRAMMVMVAMLASSCYRGSARTVSVNDVKREPGWTLASGMTLIRQSNEHGCGAAALAMIFRRWGVPSSESEIARATPGSQHPGSQQGIAAGALRDLARQKGLQAFLIRGEEADLVREVALDRPVLVGLVQRYTSRAYAHYEVVVGINPSTRRVLMFDPGRGVREDQFDAFDKEWGGADRLTLVIGPP